MTKKLLVLLAIFLMLSTVLMACSSKPSTSDDAEESTGAETADGQEESDASNSEPLLPQVETTNLDGEAVAGKDIGGEKLTVLNVWATWCPPCVEELPHLQEISKEFADQGVKVVGVMQDGVTEALQPNDATIKSGKELLEKSGVDYPVILPDETLQRELISQMQYFPTTFFLDAEGKVINTVVGAKDLNGWKNEIESALK